MSLAESLLRARHNGWLAERENAGFNQQGTASGNAECQDVKEHHVPVVAASISKSSLTGWSETERSGSKDDELAREVESLMQAIDEISLSSNAGSFSEEPRPTSSASDQTTTITKPTARSDASSRERSLEARRAKQIGQNNALLHAEQGQNNWNSFLASGVDSDSSSKAAGGDQASTWLFGNRVQFGFKPKSTKGSPVKSAATGLSSPAQSSASGTCPAPKASLTSTPADISSPSIGGSQKADNGSSASSRFLPAGVPAFLLPKAPYAAYPPLCPTSPCNSLSPSLPPPPSPPKPRQQQPLNNLAFGNRATVPYAAYPPEPPAPSNSVPVFPPLPSSPGPPLPASPPPPPPSSSGLASRAQHQPVDPLTMPLEDLMSSSTTEQTRSVSSSGPTQSLSSESYSRAGSESPEVTSRWHKQQDRHLPQGIRQPVFAAASAALCQDVWYLTVDTNCFLEDAEVAAIKAIVEGSSTGSKSSARSAESWSWTGGKQVVVVLPNAVIRELDGLKNNTYGVGPYARRALRFLRDHMKSRSPWLRCQSQGEHLQVAREPCSADDAILGCCLYFARHVAEHGQTVLLTNDIALQCKTLSYKLDACSAAGFVVEHLMPFEFDDRARGANAIEQALWQHQGLILD